MTEENMRELRKKTAIAIARRAETWGDVRCEKDYLLDDLYRQLADLPPRPIDRAPLAGFFPTEISLRAILPGREFPERQLSQGNYPECNSPVLGHLWITGGFMEAHGHSWKSAKLAIFGDGILRRLPASNRNLGIDYVTPKIKAWYGGVCYMVRLERGYGLRGYFRWDVSYKFNGKDYPVFGAFAHASRFKASKGHRVEQGEHIGDQGNSGGNYPPHIDYRQWIVIDGKSIDLSPNALEKQLHG